MMYFGVSVADLRAGTYSCRPRNNQMGAKVSEHAFGNAMDVMAFVLADGREINVEKGWRGDPAEQEFLREAFVGACRYFTTVLAPGSDPFHYNHIHIDLVRHDPRGQRRICKPILKFTPRIDPEQSREILQSAASNDVPAIELDQDVPEGQAYVPPPPASSMAAPLAPPPVAAPVPPAPRYSADLPGASAGAPRTAPQGYPQQTYAPPGAARPSTGAPMVLNSHAVY
jgi:hypothetical protein